MESIHHARVESCTEETIGSGIYELSLDLGSQTGFNACPGQFVVLEPQHPVSVMPRPFSIVDVQGDFITILLKEVGKNTLMYSRLSQGDEIKIYGPQGTGFEFDPETESYILVGGGIGSAALIYLAKLLKEKNIPFIVLLGAKSQDQIAGLSFFHELTDQVFTICDSGPGKNGFVTDLLRERLIGDKSKSTIVSCGPKPMLKKVAEICREFGNKCSVMLEELMACGMGSCKGCAIWGIDKIYKHVCSDGPVFDAKWIDWERFLPEPIIQLTSQIDAKAEIVMRTNLAGIELEYPSMNSSGCLSAEALKKGQFDYRRLGALVTKGVGYKPKSGNPMPRTCEVTAGMMNSIGLENVGIEKFVKYELFEWLAFGKPVIANIFGESVAEIVEVASQLKGTGVAALEVNISCPNVKKGGMAFGIDPFSAAQVTEAVCRVSDVPVIVKLSPNVTDIVSIARAVVDAGADAISLINTLLGLAIDHRTRKPKIANIIGGFSGPAVKPVALRMVYQIFKANLGGVPIIGMGGICNAEDAAEFMMAGANVYAVGTGGFGNREVFSEINDGLEKIIRGHGFSSVEELVGSLII